MKRIRSSQKLSESVHRQLNMYALAASAAGVGMLALAQPAGAEIVYTKVHEVIWENSMVDLDLDHDGKWDFALVEQDCAQYSCYSDNSLCIQGRSVRAGVEGTASRGIWVASAVKKGQFIGPNKSFLPVRSDKMFLAAHLCGYLSCVTTGRWVDVKDRYLGLRLQIAGKAHYGWARLSVNYAPPINLLYGVLTGYAYETIPNKAIIAGKTKGPDVITVEPGSLGALAGGASGPGSAR